MTSVFDPALDTPDEPTPPAVAWAGSGRGATALAWVDVQRVAADTLPVDAADAANATATPSAPDEPAPEADLLADAALRPAALRSRVVTPVAVLAAMIGGYAATTLLWPLDAVAPVVDAATLAPAAAPAAELTWPDQGSAGVVVDGFDAASSSDEEAPIASLTKVVSALMVLDELPLEVGEQGPEFSFTYGDSVEYWDYRRSDQSALDVPVDGVLTEYQMLQGVLLGSANNYIDRLAEEIWQSRGAFQAAARTWLAERGFDDITIATPSGFDARNVATPEALLELAEYAMDNPVIAEIVGTKAVDLPGAGHVVNTNGMLDDPGVVGIKTGALHDDWNLLTAKDVTIGDTTVRLYAAVLGQADDDQRLAVTRSLFTEVEDALRAQEPAVPAGTVVGHVRTAWGATTEIVTDADAAVVLWNGSAAETSVRFALDEWEQGAAAGELTVTGPADQAKTSVSLADELEGPDAWWRLTHPLELFGLSQ